MTIITCWLVVHMRSGGVAGNNNRTTFDLNRADVSYNRRLGFFGCGVGGECIQMCCVSFETFGKSDKSLCHMLYRWWASNKKTSPQGPLSSLSLIILIMFHQKTEFTRRCFHFLPEYFMLFSTWLFLVEKVPETRSV